MPPEDDILYFGHMLDAARWIRRRLGAMSRAEFDLDEDLQFAVTHQLQVIGEAAGKVSDQGRQTAPNVPWRQITGMRNRIVHDYTNINLDVVWDTAARHLDPLIAELTRLLPEEPSP